MNLLQFAIKNLIHRKWGALLTLLLLSLGLALGLFFTRVKELTENETKKNAGTVQLVIGAKGSPIQLILSSLFHIDNPTGNIPYAALSEFQHHPLLKTALPISIGDQYKGHRIVGCTEGYAELFELEIAEGSWATNAFEITLGHAVAQNRGLHIGDHLHSAHGLTETEGDHHEHDHGFTVVGILEPKNSIHDHLLFTPNTSVWESHHMHEGEREISAILCEFRNPMGLMKMPRYINESTPYQASVVTYELDRIEKLMGSSKDMLDILVYLLIAFSIMSGAISLSISFKELKPSLLYLRIRGASGRAISMALIWESLILSSIALLLGLLGSRFSLFFLGQEIGIQNIKLWSLSGTEALFMAFVLLANLISIIPIVRKAYGEILTFK